jgi:hypothetical protein
LEAASGDQLTDRRDQMVRIYILVSGFLFLLMLLEILKSDLRNIETVLRCTTDYFRREKKKKKGKPESLYEIIRGNVDRGFRLISLCRILLIITAVSALLTLRISMVSALPDIMKEILLTGYGITIVIIAFILYLVAQSWGIIKMVKENRLIEALMNRMKDDELL